MGRSDFVKEIRGDAERIEPEWKVALRRSSQHHSRQDIDPATLHMRSILEFARLAEADSDNGLSFGWKYYDDDSHGSVPLIAEYDAFRFMFPWYSRLDLTNSLYLDPATPVDQLLGMIETHFDSVSSHFGYRVLPPENYINFRSRGFAANERPDAALAFLNLNLQNYPQSPKAHEAIGDYHLDEEDTDAALLHFTHAVDLGAGDETQEKIASLLADD